MADASTSTRSAAAVDSAFSKHFGESRYTRYFAEQATLDVTETAVRVFVKEGFYKDWLASRYGDDLLAFARDECGLEDPEIDWVIDPQRFGVAAPAVEARGPEPAEAKLPRVAAPSRSRSSLWKNPPLKGKLADFIIGSCNRLAYQTAKRVASDDRSVDFSLLFLHGECGVGKTHLLQGIVSEFIRTKPGARVRYVTGEAFTNRYISAIRSNKMSGFRDAFRGLDLLCIDDVHFISGKNGTQSECLHTLDELDLHGARIVLASDEHPRRIAKLDQRLTSRLLSGMIVAMDRPDEATRRSLIQRIATQRGLGLDPAALGHLSERCDGSARDIIGAMTRVEALLDLVPEAGAQARAVTPAIVQRAMGELDLSRPARPIRVSEISRTVCAELLVDLTEMLGSSRHKRVVLARSLTAYLSRQLTTHSYPEIAMHMNRTNHSTVVTACQRIERQMEAGELVEDPIQNQRRPVSEIAERLRAAVLRGCARMSNA